LERRLGGSQTRSWPCGEKFLIPAANRSLAIKPTAHPYIDCAIPPHNYEFIFSGIKNGLQWRRARLLRRTGYDITGPNRDLCSDGIPQFVYIDWGKWTTNLHQNSLSPIWVSIWGWPCRSSSG
jgi:hypothetical protein